MIVSDGVRMITGHGFNFVEFRASGAAICRRQAPHSMLFEAWTDLGLIGALARGADSCWPIKSAAEQSRAAGALLDRRPDLCLRHGRCSASPPPGVVDHHAGARRSAAFAFVDARRLQDRAAHRAEMVAASHDRAQAEATGRPFSSTTRSPSSLKNSPRCGGRISSTFSAGGTGARPWG